MKIKLSKRVPTNNGNLLKLIMRTLIFMCCALTFGLTPNRVFTQKEKVEITESAAFEIAEVFDLIVAKTEYNFLYARDEFEGAPRVALTAGEIRVDRLLNKCLKATPFTYMLSDDNTIILQRKQVEGKFELPQQLLTGTVTDNNGTPLPGVTVLINLEGSTVKTGTYTDFEGKYSVEVPEGATIAFSYVGFATKEFEYSGQTELNVQMVEAANQLDEVIVSTGYQKISKARSTGSATVIKLDEVKDNRTSDNIFDIIEGTVPGLLQSPGTAGRTNLTLRGTVQTENFGDPLKDEPLVVIDGFPIGGRFGSGNQRQDVASLIERINPEDVESISVLRDAASASIWGAQAANGVIVITTKRGSRNTEAEFSVTSSVSFQQAQDFTEGNFASVQTLIEQQQFRADIGRFSRSSNFFLAGPNNPVLQAYVDFNSGAITQQELDNVVNTASGANLIGEYNNLFIRTALKQRQTLSMSQGGEGYNFYGSFNYDNESYNQIGEEDRRMIGNLSLSADLAKGITFSGRINYSNQKNLNNGIGNNPSTYEPFYRFLENNGDYVQYPGVHRDYIERFEADGVPYDWYDNDKRDFDNSDNTDRFSTIDVFANLDVTLLPGLTAQLGYNYQDRRLDRESLYNEETYLVRNLVNRSGIYFDDDGSFLTPVVIDRSQGYNGFVLPTGHILDKRSEVATSSGGRAQLNFAKYIDNAQKHYVSAIAGVDYREENRADLLVDRIYGYNPRTLARQNVDTYGRYADFTGRERQAVFLRSSPIARLRDRFLANYFNGAYTYNNKYTVSGSWRLDDTNLFGSSPEYRNNPFWSVGAKWQIAREAFLQESELVNQLDLRLSRGTSGNIDRSTTPFLTTRTTTDFSTQVVYSYINSLENQELRWETTTTNNIALDFALFNRKFSGSFEWYDRNTTGLLQDQNVNPTNGFSRQLRNFANVSNKGFDLTLNYRPILSENFSWSINGVLSHNKNEIIRLDNNFDSPFARTAGNFIEGDPISGFYAYRWAGLDENGAPQVFDAEGNIVDYLTNVEIEDLEYQGQFNPRYYGSFGNSVTYKNFTLQALLTFQMGHMFRRDTHQMSFGTFTARNLHSDFENRWQNPGDEATTDVPALIASPGGNYGPYHYRSNLFTEKADHIRLTSLSMNYDVDAKWLQRTFINSLRFGVNAQNLGVIWTANDFNIDPIIGNAVGSVRSEPIYSFNARLSF